MGEDFKMQVTPGWCGWVGIIDTDWNRVSYNLIFLEDASLSNYVLSIVAWDTNHLSMKNYRYEQPHLDHVHIIPYSSS